MFFFEENQFKFCYFEQISHNFDNTLFKILQEFLYLSYIGDDVLYERYGAEVEIPIKP